MPPVAPAFITGGIARKARARRHANVDLRQAHRSFEIGRPAGRTGSFSDLGTAAVRACPGELHSLELEAYDLKLRSAPQRLANYLLSLVQEPDEKPARFVLPFEKRLLAARIGCSQENLSRAFAALRPLGVETQRGVIVLRDISVLRSFACQGRH